MSYLSPRKQNYTGHGNDENSTTTSYGLTRCSPSTEEERKTPRLGRLKQLTYQTKITRQAQRRTPLAFGLNPDRWDPKRNANRLQVRADWRSTTHPRHFAVYASAAFGSGRGDGAAKLRSQPPNSVFARPTITPPPMPSRPRRRRGARCRRRLASATRREVLALTNLSA